MALCEVVASLAEAVRESYEPLTPGQLLLVYQLRSMPLYRDIGRLDMWEGVAGDVPDESGEDPSPAGQWLRAVYEFGRYNLYAAFDERGTRSEYRILVNQLSGSCVPTQTEPDLSDW